VDRRFITNLAAKGQQAVDELNYLDYKTDKNADKIEVIRTGVFGEKFGYLGVQSHNSYIRNG